jgi:hypothetical protein
MNANGLLEDLVAKDYIHIIYKKAKHTLKGAAPRFPSEDKERLLSEILRSCQNYEFTIIILII